jgi:hypothetical protein
MGRILPQMEQTRTQFPTPTRLRIHNGQLQALPHIRHVRHLPSQCLCARARHGDRDAKAENVSIPTSGTSLLSCVELVFTDFLTLITAHTNPAHCDQQDPCDKAEQAYGKYRVLAWTLCRFPASLRGLCGILAHVSGMIGS